MFCPFNIAKVAETLLEGLDEAASGRRRPEKTDDRDISRRLRVSGEQRGEEHRSRASNERPPLHYSIT